MRRRKLAVSLVLVLLLLGAGPASAFRGGHMRRGGHGGLVHDDGRHLAAHLYHARYVHQGHQVRVFARRIDFGTWQAKPPQPDTVVHAARAPYHYADGVYCVKKSATCYVTVPAPTGAVIASLPDGAATVPHDGETYHYYVGSWYERTRKGYRVVAAPVGATVAYAPKGARKKAIDDRTYYVHAGVYYLPQFVDGLARYRVVARPGAKEAPAPGVLDEPPAGYISVEHDGLRYGYVDGDWFVAIEGGYIATRAPVGASVPYLPVDVEKQGEGFACKGMVYVPYAKDGATLYKVERSAG
jgi:hypothetical protein